MEITEKMEISKYITADIVAYSIGGISPRETEALLWVALGKTYEEVGLILGISKRTARAHFNACQEKFNTKKASAPLTISVGFLRGALIPSPTSEDTYFYPLDSQVRYCLWHNHWLVNNIKNSLNREAETISIEQLAVYRYELTFLIEELSEAIEEHTQDLNFARIQVLTEAKRVMFEQVLTV